MTRKLYLITVLIMMIGNSVTAFYFGQHFGWEERTKGILGVVVSATTIVTIWFYIVRSYDRGSL